MKHLSIIAVLAVGTLLIGCDLDNNEKQRKLTKAQVDSQIALQVAQVNLQIKQVDRDIQAVQQMTDVRLAVVKACVAHKGTPVVLNGNVECKK